MGERDDMVVECSSVAQPAQKLPSSMTLSYLGTDLYVCIFSWPGLISSSTRRNSSNEQKYIHLDLDVRPVDPATSPEDEPSPPAWHALPLKSFKLIATYEIGEGKKKKKQSLFKLEPEPFWKASDPSKSSGSYWVNDHTLRLIFERKILSSTKLRACHVALALRYTDLGDDQHHANKPQHCSIGDGKVVWYSKGGFEERQMHIPKLYPKNVPIEVTRWQQQLDTGLSVKKPSPQTEAKRKNNPGRSRAAEKKKKEQNRVLAAMQQRVAELEVERDSAQKQAAEFSRLLEEAQAREVALLRTIHQLQVDQHQQLQVDQHQQQLTAQGTVAPLLTQPDGQQQTGNMNSGPVSCFPHPAPTEEAENEWLLLQQQLAAQGPVAPSLTQFAGHQQQEQIGNVNSGPVSCFPYPAPTEEVEKAWLLLQQQLAALGHSLSTDDDLGCDGHHGLMSSYASSGHQHEAGKEGHTKKIRAKRQRTKMATSDDPSSATGFDLPLSPSLLSLLDLEWCPGRQEA